MPSKGESRVGRAERLAEIKAISGWCIERRRWQMDVTQENVASDAGITSRWVREIEGGNPRTTLDDHLKCAAALDLSIAYLAIPMLYMERSIGFPRDFLLTDLEAIEDRCVAAITEQILARFRTSLQPGGGR